MKQFLLFLTFIILSVASKAQSAEDSVKTVISKLFEGMKNSDTTLLKTAFADNAILQTVGRDKDGGVRIENDNVSGFAMAVSKLPKGDADERIVYDVIKIDGPLAIVWAPYKFYYKGVFSHCGIDSFQLVKINGEWKVQYLIDTRKKKGCE
ncbi:nuclear transport factor 2 family protein [Ferruginibacter profundus]